MTDEELAKARNIMLADFWRDLATINGKAGAIGNYEVFHGSYETLFELPGRIEAVTLDELRETAGRVFREDNLTIGTLVAPPEEEPS